MRSAAWLFLLLILPISFALQCFKDEQIRPKDKEIIYGKKTARTRNTTSRCVILRSHNGTHTRAYRGIWPAWQLPTDCLQYGEHCFWVHNFKNVAWAGCCCNKTRCNEKDDAVFMFYPEQIGETVGASLLQWFRTFLYLCAFVTVPLWITAAVTFIYVRGSSRFQTQKKYEDCDEEERRMLNFDMEDNTDSDEETARKQLSTSSHFRPSSSNRAFRVRKRPSHRQPTTSLSLKATTPEILASTPVMTPLLNESVTALTPSRASSLEVTKSTQETPFYRSTPVRGIEQERARSVKLSNGRIQHVSVKDDDDERDD